MNYRKNHTLNIIQNKISPKRLRICIFACYPPSRARLSEYTEYMVKALSKYPLDIVVFSNSSQTRRIKDNLLIISGWKADNPLSLLMSPLKILKLNPDVIHFNIHFQSFGRRRITNFIGFFLIPLFKLIGKKVIVTLHNIAELIDLKSVMLKPNFFNKIGILMATYFVLKSDVITVTVKAYQRYLQYKYNTDKVIFIPHGTLPPDPAIKRVKKRIILLFGHMSPYKGLDIALKAFEKVKKKMCDIKLLIVGSDHPNYPGYIKKVLKNLSNIMHVNYVPNDKLYRIFSVSDIVVLPYLIATGTSGVFHLACSFGKPIIASNLLEIRELVKRGARALLVPPGDPEELADAILKLLNDEELIRTMSESNLKFAERETFDNIALKFFNLYHKMFR